MNTPPPRRGSWVQQINSRFSRRSVSSLKVLDLFCGAGGLSLGFWTSGFDVVGMDWNPDAVESYMLNLGEAHCVDVNHSQTMPAADVIVAGPPCQPWSRAGKRMGASDTRDGLAVVMRIVEAQRPRAVVIENVPDLAISDKRSHLDSLKSQLDDMDYGVSENILNAADYGVPQNRRRIFVTGLLHEQPFEPPAPWPNRISVSEAIPETCERYAAGTSLLSDAMDEYIRRYEMASGCRTPRDMHLDRPSRTLTVRNLCGATGDMVRLRLASGERRTLTVREAARLQSFP